LLKKYEEMMADSLFLIFSHLMSLYRIMHADSANTDSPSEKIREAQLLRNSGESIPFSKNLSLYESDIKPSILIIRLKKFDKISKSIFENSRIWNIILTCAG